jgi:4'-phosphopantetheinyl transferase
MTEEARSNMQGSASARTAVKRAEVRIWWTFLDTSISSMNRLATVLMEDERVHAGTYHFPHDRWRFAASRAFLRYILAVYPDMLPAELRLTYEPYGNPFVQPSCTTTPVTFSLARAGQLCTVAVSSGQAVGVDVKRVLPRDRLERMVEAHFSSIEQAIFRALPDAVGLDTFYSGWTRKEACLKASGTGLSIPPREIEVALTSEQPVQVLVPRGPGSHPLPCALCPQELAPGYACAVAIEGDLPRLACYNVESAAGGSDQLQQRVPRGWGRVKQSRLDMAYCTPSA